jgi:hypothetical protein
MDEQEPSKNKIVVRIDPEIYGRVFKIAKRRKTTTTATIEDGLKYFLNDAENSIEILMELVDQQPSLKLHRDLIKNVFKNSEKSDPETLRSVIEIIKKGEVSFYENFYFEELEEKINKINLEKCQEVLVVARVNPAKRIPNQFQEVVKNIKKLNCENSLDLLFDDSLDQEFNFMAFILLKKENDKNG